MSSSGKIKIGILFVTWKRNIIPGLDFPLVLLLQEKVDVVILVLGMQGFGLMATQKFE
jgi:hypothetical protein